MLLLASRSPRRADLLAAAGIPFEVFPGDVDETPFDHETPEAHVERLALEKARVAAARRPDAVVLSADTVVVVDGRILGKPRDSEEAEAMLRALSGRDHEVLSGICLLVRGRTPTVEISRTRVWVFPLSDEEIAWYVGTGEPMDKAGAYAIQGLGSRFIERIDGSYANVVGLPVGRVYRILQDMPESRHFCAP